MTSAKKIIFVNPPLSIEDRYGVKSQSGGQTPPLGLLCLASMTRERGFDTSILDAAALRLGYGESVRAILERSPGYVGITAVTISIAHAAELAARLKKADPGLVVMIGGPHLTALPSETMEKYPQFDLGVIGEADYTIIEVLEALEAGRDLSGINGLILRTPAGAAITGPRERIGEMDALPLPAWDLLPDLTRHYCPPVHTLKRIPAALLVASRGCPGKCVFCDRSVFGNVLRAYSARYVFEMIKELYHKHGVREIQLRDDNFTAYRKRTLELCALLREARLDLVWTCAGRVDMVNPELLKAMKEAGCWQIWYGVESGSDEILAGIMKHTTTRQIREAVRMTRDAGISPCGFFIIGHPGETIDTLEQTLRFSRELPLDEAHFSFMTPFPGAWLYDHAEEYGSFDRDWRRLHGWLPVFVPHGLTAGILETYSKRAFRGFYFRPRIILSYILRIRSLRHAAIYFRGFLALMEWLLKSRRPKKSGTRD
ncbi:MAG: Cobalamin B12-binding:Radical SAM [Elusimicrobia bacterium]|nr:MAG: Cobalamin B12-binding:Radical SAM [Elusimicrobiota bacterium]KAF0157341.1 MAG: Cobalamin B12-binding:Radical SAM [Elusimicrobiota bacterium]